jgi:site-specific DNA-methyltransferase (adenine-specific)
MTPYWQDDLIQLYYGDCREVVASLADCSVDSIVTDPPAGISFMGKGWDHNKGGRDAWVSWLTEVMRECLRVLKPGGHALVWSLPRTSHWTGWAIESAGFEVRERISHLFSTGFPKSLNVSKAIDGVIGTQGKGFIVAGDDGRAAEFKQDHSKRADYGYLYQPATDAAKQWSGWGTALKPACEDWWLCRKPIEGTIAENVLRHGTGGLNIDGCRIEGVKPQVTQGINSNPTSFNVATERRLSGDPSIGRWPSNICHDGSDEVLAGFPDSQDGIAVQRNGGGQALFGGIAGNTNQVGARSDQGFGGGGSAARFFYCSKSSQEDRNKGLDDLPLRSAGEVTDRKDGSAGLDSPRAGAGRISGSRNFHPTCKSTRLMRYLCRLITPPNGLILDPFCGSGSTGKAAVLEGFRAILIDISPDYCELAKHRIQEPPSLFNERVAEVVQPNEPEIDEQVSLFAEVDQQ